MSRGCGKAVERRVAKAITRAYDNVQAYGQTTRNQIFVLLNFIIIFFKWSFPHRVRQRFVDENALHFTSHQILRFLLSQVSARRFFSSGRKVQICTHRVIHDPICFRAALQHTHEYINRKSFVQPVVLSGIQPTGSIHLGNYLGELVNLCCSSGLRIGSIYMRLRSQSLILWYTYRGCLQLGEHVEANGVSIN